MRVPSLRVRLSGPVPSLLLLLVLGGGVACDPDRGKRIVEEVEREYRVLVDEGVPPGDRRLRALAEKLSGVPESSEAKPRAEVLARQLRKGAGPPPPPRPLAIASPGGQGGADGGTHGGAGCVAEVERLAEASVAERPRRMGELRECREREERVRAHSHAEPAPGEPPGGHPPHPAGGQTHPSH